MPHLVILYTGNLDAETDMTALCRSLADTMLAAHDDAGKPVSERARELKREMQVARQNERRALFE